MTDSPRLTPARRTKQAVREARLARALRENLRRRKEQARAQAGAREPASPATRSKRGAAGGDPPA